MYGGRLGTCHVLVFYMNGLTLYAKMHRNSSKNKTSKRCTLYSNLTDYYNPSVKQTYVSVPLQWLYGGIYSGKEKENFKKKDVYDTCFDWEIFNDKKIGEFVDEKIIGFSPLCKTAVLNIRFDDKYVCFEDFQSFWMQKLGFEI